MLVYQRVDLNLKNNWAIEILKKGGWGTKWNGTINGRKQTRTPNPPNQNNMVILIRKIANSNQSQCVPMR